MIPKLLETIEKSGGWITIDAMGRQTEIAEKIIHEGTDYCLAVQENQPSLHEGGNAFFLDYFEDDSARINISECHTQETAHGRVNEQSYYTCKVPSDLPDQTRWKKLSMVGMSVNSGERRQGDGIAVRYYILSKPLTGSAFAGAVRDHWGIENSCQWRLDVTVGEDQCRLRKNHGDGIFSTLRQTALSLLKKETTAKCGIKNK